MLKIRKTFDSSREIVKSLQEKAKITLKAPERGNRADTGTPKEMAWKNEEITAKWQMEYKVYLSKKEKCDDNWTKVYALIWESYCSRELQIAIQERLNIETTIKDDPL